MTTVISCIVPCYNEEAMLPDFMSSLDTVIQKFSHKYPEVSFEIIFINDGSSDNTQDVLEQLCARYDYQMSWASFSRNFGKEAALYAGLKKAKGDFVAVMDADCQDPPHLLLEMYPHVCKGEYDCAAAKRINRKGEPPLRSFFARLFYWFINKISETNIEKDARDFRLMSRKVVDSILELSEYNRFSKGLFSWVGFKTKWIEYENELRTKGGSKWSFFALCRYAIDGIISFSTMPLTLAAVVGTIISLIAIIFLIFIIVRAIIFSDPVAGWPSLMSVVLLLGGIQTFFLGIIGKYLAKTFLETKKRPLYIIADESE